LATGHFLSQQNNTKRQYSFRLVFQQVDCDCTLIILTGTLLYVTVVMLQSANMVQTLVEILCAGILANACGPTVVPKGSESSFAHPKVVEAMPEPKGPGSYNDIGKLWY